MRRIFFLLLSVVFALPLVSAAAAAELPAVTLTITEDAVNGGFPVSVVLTTDQPMPADTVILFSGPDDAVYSATFAAGETEVTISVDTPVVSRRATFTCALAAGEGYRGESSDTVTVYALPKLSFYQSIYVRKAEKECVIAVTLTQKNLLEDGAFELCDQIGNVLATLTIKQNTQLEQFYFKWIPDKTQAGRLDLSIWWNGYVVSEEPGYLALYAGDQLVVRNYDVKEKFIALSLDCAYQWAYVDGFLEMLDRQEVKVTFFMTGLGVEGNPDAVLKMQAHGHELGNHSCWHYHMETLDNLLTVRREIRTTSDLWNN